MGLPVRYKGDSYESDERQTAALEALAEGGVYLHGKCGVGKTYLVTREAQREASAGRDVLYWRVSELMQRFLEINRATSDEVEGRLLDRLYTAEVLVMDDIGAEKATEYIGMILGRIIDARYNRELRTLMTSNLSLKQLETKYNAADPQRVNGTRMTDRIRAMCKVVEIVGESRRESK